MGKSKVEQRLSRNADPSFLSTGSEGLTPVWVVDAATAGKGMNSVRMR